MRPLSSRRIHHTRASSVRYIYRTKMRDSTWSRAMDASILSNVSSPSSRPGMPLPRSDHCTWRKHPVWLQIPLGASACLSLPLTLGGRLLRRRHHCDRVGGMVERDCRPIAGPNDRVRGRRNHAHCVGVLAGHIESALPRFNSLRKLKGRHYRASVQCHVRCIARIDDHRYDGHSLVCRAHERCLSQSEDY